MTRVHLSNPRAVGSLGDRVVCEALVALCAPLALHGALPVDGCAPPRGMLPPVACASDDVLLNVGGDVFRNTRTNAWSRAYAGDLLALRRMPAGRGFVFGPSLSRGCVGAALALLASVLARLASVTVRDEPSCERLRRAGVRAGLSYDVGFAYRPARGALDAAKSLYQRAQVDPDRVALIAPRRYDPAYPQDDQQVVARIIALYQILEHRGLRPVILIQNGGAQGAVDRAIADEVRRMIDRVRVIDPYLAEGECPDGGATANDPLGSLFGVIALANSVVALRYHAAVLRLVAGRQVVNLFHSPAGMDLSRRLGLAGSSLRAFDPRAIAIEMEKSADRVFDARPIAQHVREAFADALRAAGAAGIGQAVAPVPAWASHGSELSAATSDRATEPMVDRVADAVRRSPVTR